MLSDIDPALTVSFILGIVGSGGAGAFIKTVWERRDGTEIRKVTEVERINHLYEKERDRADDEAVKRRKLDEYASALRRLIITECGSLPESVREWPY